VTARPAPKRREQPRGTDEGAEVAVQLLYLRFEISEIILVYVPHSAGVGPSAGLRGLPGRLRRAGE
jgi:hypothetical protein